VTDDGSVVFRGIPFAAPPVGERRWKPPQPVEPWDGVRDTLEEAPTCPQPDQGWNAFAMKSMSEDCLYLNVRRPDLSPDAPLPVMVWIHGGGNVAGGAADVIEGSVHKRGVALVSSQYRLGALGFMAHPAFAAESSEGASGNYALMDDQAALRWVQKNIARFGGDPGNVTIFGESAGGQHVGMHLLSPGSRGLFHRAIEESGTSNFGAATRSLKDAEEIGRAWRRAGLPVPLRSRPAGRRGLPRSGAGLRIRLRAGSLPGERPPASLLDELRQDGRPERRGPA